MSQHDIDLLQSRFGPFWRWLAVGTVMLGTMATVLSATIINVALPHIMVEFSVDQGQAHWLVTGFLGAVTAIMLASGWLLDHLGVRKTLAIAMLLFTGASILGAASPNLPTLITARVLQGVSAGLLQPLAMFMIFRVFPKNERGRAMGIYGMGVIVAPALGPVLGGIVVDQLDWRFVLLAPAPITLLGFCTGLRYLPDADPKQTRYPFDIAGLALLSLFLLLILDTLNRLQHGIDHLLAMLLEGIAVVVTAVGFLIRQRQASNPLLNFKLLRQPSFLAANLATLVLGFSLYGSTYLIPLFVQTALGYSATDAGLLMLPAGIVLGLIFPFAGRLADRKPQRPQIMGGLIAFALAGICFALSDVDAPFLALASFAVLGRIGLGFMMPALSIASLNPLPSEVLGQASSTVNFSRQFGGALGVTLLATLIEFGPVNAAGHPALEAYHAAWWGVAACALLALVPVWHLGASR